MTLVSLSRLVLALACNVALCSSALAAEGAAAPPKDEGALIAILNSDAPAAEKAITCKRLAIYGGKDAVPVLAPLLANPELASWARIALEAIPDATADQALRSALDNLEGKLLIGVINSLGNRHDRGAVTALAARLKNADPQIASAAAESLGQIGGPDAAKALQQSLNDNRPEVRSSAAYGAVVCAEQLLADGDAAAAAALCDQVRQANVPKQRVLEATRGAILARKSKGIPLLVEQIRSPDFALFGIGVRVARELPGRDVTQAVAAEMDRANPERQVPLLLALADRTDAAVLPKVLQVAERGPKPVRLTALGLLDRYRDLASVPVLLSAATEADADLARTAKSTLARLGGKEVDADLVGRLRLATAKVRPVLIELAGQRRIEEAVPLVMRSTEDPNPEVRRAAVEALGLLGTEQQVGGLVRLLSSTQDADEREDLERALTAVSRRSGPKALPDVLPLAQGGNTGLRKVGLRALASIGGPQALGVIKAAVNDRDEAIQDEAVNLLSTWPNTWPEDTAVAEPLLALARSDRKPAHKVQGLRGYLLYLEENQKLSSDEKVDKIQEILPFAEGAEGKRQVIAVAGTIPSPSSLDLLNSLAKDPDVAEEAYAAITKIAGDRRLGSPDVRRKALQAVLDGSENDTTKKRAADQLKRLK